MLPKVSFADDSYFDFREQTAAAEDYFGTYERYGGMAVHFYATYRSLTRAGRTTSTTRAD